MTHCNNCNVYIDDGVQICPLCNNHLKVEDANAKNSCYPDYFHKEEISYKRRNKIIAFLILLIFSVSLGLINYFTQAYLKVLWSLDIIAIFAYMWVLIENTIRTKLRGSVKLFIQVFSIFFMLLVFDLVAGFENWTFNSALPIVVICALGLCAYIITKKRMALKDYYSYSAVAIIIGVLPVITYLLQLSQTYILSLIALAFSVVLFVMMVIYKVSEHPKENIIRMRMGKRR